MKSKVNFSAIIIFYIIALGLRFLTNKTDILNAIHSDFLQTVLKGIGPAAGAFVVYKIFNKKPVMSLKGNYKDLLPPVLLYWMLPILLIGLVGYFTDGKFSILGILAVLIYGLLEEIGWRGFLQQELKPLPGYQHILILTILWFCWHLNFELTVSNLIFFFILLLGSWGIGFVANKTCSLLAAAAFHSLYNFFPALELTQIIILISLLTVWILSLMIRKQVQKQCMTLL